MRDSMVALSSLFIDRFSLTFPVSSRELQHRIEGLFDGCADSAIVERVRYGELLARYYFAYTLPLAWGQSAIIQLAPRDSRMNFLRLEFNPNHPGPAQEHPFLMLEDILRRVWPAFSSAPVLERARVSRVDFAVDIHDVHIDRLGICHSTRSVSSRIFERGGQTTGIYLGARKSKHYVAIYDKKVEASDCRGITLERECTRVESCSRDIGRLSALSNMRNPFELFTLHLYPPYNQVDHEHVHFFDSCRYRGVQAALYLIQNRRKRAAYRAWLSETCRLSWWHPDVIWGQRMDALQRALGG
jgi:hypothetical protein